MVGQLNIVNQIKHLKNNNKLPRFILLQGAEGYGKKTLCKEIGKMCGFDVVLFGNKVDELRDCIDLAYKQKEPIIYVLQDSDTMSLAAKNSILKLVEEPPVNAYIIMLCENEQSILPTIISRAFFIKMEPYNIDDLLTYTKQKDTAFTDNQIEVITKICDSPGMINKLIECDTEEILTFCEKVVDNLCTVTLSNALKISKKVKLTASSEGWDVKLFLNCLQYFTHEAFKKTKCDKYCELYSSIVRIKKLISNASISKLYSIDSLIIGGWKLWNYGN